MRTFLKCGICGNIVGMIEDKGVIPVCCGEPMKRLAAHTAQEETGREKHVPVATRQGDLVTVKVGSVEHPMSPEHHIAWIVVACEGMTQRMVLKPESKPEAVFHMHCEGPITVYAYCNLHGLWTSEA